MIRLLTLCCLVYGVTAELFITNDVKAQPGEFPYQVSLRMNGQHICGGSLIESRHVVTAAHCIHPIILNPALKPYLKIVVGTTSLSSGIVYDVARVAQPVFFNEQIVGEDIAVIRLAKPIVESANVKIIGLPPANIQLVEGQKLIASGFGGKQIGQTPSPYLKKIDMTAVAHVKCQQAWTQGYYTVVSGGILCAGTPTGDGICTGDSGGPLVTSDKKTLVGVVAATNRNGCGTGTPDLFTRVSAYLQFIYQEIARP